MKDIIYEFLDYISYEKKYSTNTEDSYEVDLFKYEQYLKKNNLNYLKVKYKDVSEFTEELSIAGYKASTVNRTLSSLRSFYNFLYKRGITKENPFDMVKSLKTEKRLPNFFKYNEFEEMINTLSDSPLDTRNRLILELLFSTGLRVSELVNIKLNDIDVANKEIRVMGKGKKERIVFFNDYSKDAMCAYVTNVRGSLLNGKQSPFLFINHNGTVLTTRGVRMIIENIVKKACIKSKVSPHTFRHTFATILLNEGCSIKSVQELLGHASLSTTGIYTHLTNEEVMREYFKAHPRA